MRALIKKVKQRLLEARALSPCAVTALSPRAAPFSVRVGRRTHVTIQQAPRWPAGQFFNFLNALCM
eukprot:jgi/Botrbrau1/7596/Bobra.0159s0045.1